MTSGVTPIIAEFALVVAAALLCGGLYALFGKPSTHNGEKRKQRVVNGFRLGGGILLGIILMGMLVSCSQIAFALWSQQNCRGLPLSSLHWGRWH